MVETQVRKRYLSNVPKVSSSHPLSMRTAVSAVTRLTHQQKVLIPSMIYVCYVLVGALSENSLTFFLKMDIVMQDFFFFKFYIKFDKHSTEFYEPET